MLCFKNWLKQSKKQFHLYPHCADSIPVLLTEARCPFIKPIFLLEKRHQIFIGKKTSIHTNARCRYHPSSEKTNLMFLAFAISSGQSFLLRNGGDPKGARHCGNNPFFENLFYLEFGKKPWKSSRYINQSDKSKIIKMQTSTGLGPYFHHMAKGPELRVTSKQDWNAPAIWWG